MLLDTSSTVTEIIWKNIKEFQKRLVRRMPLEVVKTSLVSFDENVKLMTSSSDFESVKNFESKITQPNPPARKGLIWHLILQKN